MTKGKKKTLLVDVNTLSDVLSCSPRHVQRLVEAGLPKAATGQYDVLVCVRWFIRDLKRRLREEGGGLEREQERKTKAEADLKELELYERLGTLIPIAVYRSDVAFHFTAIRQRFLALPGRVAATLEGEPRAQIKVKLRAAVCEVLDVLAKAQDVKDRAAAEEAAAAKSPGDRLEAATNKAAKKSITEAARALHPRYGRSKKK
jgi:hypothetical protein